MKTKISLSTIAALLILPAFLYAARADIKEITDPIKDYTTALRHQLNGHASEEELIKSIRLIRFVADFNADGLTDVAVSDTYDGAWGSAGGEWQLYLQRKSGSYIPVGRPIFFHPLAIHIKPIEKGNSQITVYIRSNVAEGSLIQSEFSDKPVKQLGTRIMKPNVNEADKKEYEKLFGHRYNSPVSEFCMLSDYLEANTCKWRKGY
jgi:hypothetical protein